jgi:hypothetical protein
MKPLLNVPIRYGLIAGLLGVALVVGLYYLNRHPFLIPVYIDFRIIMFAVFIFFSLKELRDRYQGGVLYLPQGIIASFLFLATFGVISSAAIVFFATVVPGFLSSYIKLTLEQLKGLPVDVIERIGKDTYTRNLELLPSTNATDLGFMYLVQSLIIGLFVSIILSVILRRLPKN